MGLLTPCSVPRGGFLYTMTVQGGGFLPPLSHVPGGRGGRWFWMKFMAHRAVWGRSPIKRQKTNSKKLTIKKLSKSGLGWCAKFGQANSNGERKITLSLILHFMWDFRI